MEAFVVSIIAVGIAEIGDKSLFLAILLTVRHQRPWPVFWGLGLGVTANLTLATILGIWLASWLDGQWLNWILGAVFLAVAAWALIPDGAQDRAAAPASGHSIFLTAAIGFFLLEMADKTQIATIALAASYNTLLPVLTGSVLGVILANAPAIWLGHRFAHRLPMRTVRLTAAALFALIGIWMLLDAASNGVNLTGNVPLPG